MMPSCLMFSRLTNHGGGWNDNIITAGEGIKNGDAYTTYVELDKIKASLSTGKALKGINISFFSSDVNAKVTSVKYMVENSQAPADDEDDHQLASDKVILDIKGDDLVAAGIDAQALIDGIRRLHSMSILPRRMSIHGLRQEPAVRAEVLTNTL